MLIFHRWIIPCSSFTSPSRIYSSSKRCTKFCSISRTVLPSGESYDNANPLIFYFRMHWPNFYLAHARSNDQYCISIMGLFLLVSASLLTIFEEFPSEQTIFDSPIHTIWINITAEPVLCLKFLLYTPNNIFNFSPHLWKYNIINCTWMCCP